MAAKIVQCIALLVLSTRLSVAVAQDQDSDEHERKMLLDLFETALLNDSDALWTLQNIFFNPDSKQSPEKVCLSVSISVDGIEYNKHESENFYKKSAFVYDNLWHFKSYYELHQQVDDDISDTSELANLISRSGSAGVFYSFDPSFYSIMKILSSSITLMFPVFDDSDYGSKNSDINIVIPTKLDHMPSWDNAVYVLRSVLMWVSLICPQNAIPGIILYNFALQAKFYARPNINGTQRSKEETDRSSVSDGVGVNHNYYTDQSCLSQSDAIHFLTQPSNAWILVLCMHILFLKPICVNINPIMNSVTTVKINWCESDSTLCLLSLIIKERSEIKAR